MIFGKCDQHEEYIVIKLIYKQIFVDSSEMSIEWTRPILLSGKGFTFLVTEL